MELYIKPEVNHFLNSITPCCTATHIHSYQMLAIMYVLALCEQLTLKIKCVPIIRHCSNRMPIVENKTFVSHSNDHLQPIISLDYRYWNIIQTVKSYVCSVTASCLQWRCARFHGNLMDVSSFILSDNLRTNTLHSIRLYV
jgi:hypothetical protein